MANRRVNLVGKYQHTKKVHIVLDVAALATALFGPVDLSIAAGECVAVLGASGSGKSLLLRAIADLDPHNGDVCLNERWCNKIPADEWRRLVALVPAESGWWADYVDAHFNVSPDPAALFGAVGLPDAQRWEISRLSTGERHRLAIARALQQEPRALLLDEPTASLDVGATQQIESMLKRELARGVAILLVTHDLEQARRLASRSYKMTSGRLQLMSGVKP